MVDIVWWAVWLLMPFCLLWWYRQMNTIYPDTSVSLFEHGLMQFLFVLLIIHPSSIIGTITKKSFSKQDYYSYDIITKFSHFVCVCTKLVSDWHPVQWWPGSSGPGTLGHWDTWHQAGTTLLTHTRHQPSYVEGGGDNRLISICCLWFIIISITKWV